MTGTPPQNPKPETFLKLGLRCVCGGVLMGLANLVPGISGGTMLLASGVYPRFIQAIAEVSTFRLRRASLFVLLVVVAAAVLAIASCSGAVRDLVVHHRWAMYSLFIGLTLGGVPMVWRLAQPVSRATLWGAGLGFVSMALLAYVQMRGAGASSLPESTPLFLLAGVAGAGAMILPGLSGGYLLLVLGVYVPILDAIDRFKGALQEGNLGAATEPGLSVLLPVGLGVVIGVLAVSNLLKWLLSHAERATLGVLLGLLVGAGAGLFPFQQGVRPKVGELYRGRVLTAETLETLEPHKYPTELFSPSGAQAAGALALICLGFAVTALVARASAAQGERLQ
ncbi:MAG: DUF368 domain-containing protein [Myxococcota bacterium]